MRVTQLTLRDFRTYASADVRLAPGLTVVSGRNGAGKTNLLEGALLRLHRPLVPDGQRARVRALRRGAHAAGAALRGRRTRAHEITVGFQPGEPKRLRVDGAPVERLTDVRARPLVSVFLPDRLELVTGAPALRRAHLDQVVAALRPARAATRRAYAAALAQRNALIAAIRAGPRRPRLPAGMGRRAGPPRHRADGGPRGGRRGPRAALRRPCGGPRAGGRARRSPTGRARGPRPPRRWPPSWPSGSTATSSAASPATARTATTSSCAARAATCARTARAASSGWACSRCCWPSARRWREARDAPPLMLLDDVMSELDAGRRRRLVDVLGAGGQSVITTTDLAHVPGAEDAAVGRLAIAPGTVLAGGGVRPSARQRRPGALLAHAEQGRRRCGAAQPRPVVAGARRRRRPARPRDAARRGAALLAGGRRRGVRAAGRSPSPSATAWSPWPAARRSGRRSSTCSPSTSSSA